MAVTKIATCCYCGTKAALVLRGKTQHELSCGTCGAPLRAMKMLPTQSAGQGVSTVSPNPKAKRKTAKQSAHFSKSQSKKRRKSKGFGRRVFAEIWDVIEDVVEEVFD